MKNKVDFKKCLVVLFITCSLLTFVFMLINNLEYKIYNSNYNSKIVEILGVVRDVYPDVPERNIIDVLNKKSVSSDVSLNKYGIDFYDDDIILENGKVYFNFKVLKFCFLLCSFVVVVSIFVFYVYKKDRKIKEITALIEKINKKNYSLDIDGNSEDELSILKNELYKTTVMLKEQAINESLDKVNLKNSLEDISHQLKTPLTSIMISLDNLSLNPDMDKSTRVKFISSISREVNNISFLVSSILKLSKFDANTISFYDKEVLVRDLIDSCVENVSLICDLKNVSIVVNGDKDLKMVCDSRWQIEAITNILKNAVEYSFSGGVIKLDYEQNKVVTKIVINNKGNVIDRCDLANIFKRFYKGKNSSSDSVGIGLHLAKTIILKDNGKIFVESNENNGTTFVIKYFRD